MKKLMTGNEAIARGAYEAGFTYASAYPGTPSTEILENTALYKEDILAEWGVNEKTAVEIAIGASLAGARSFAAMKHVGVNVAADPLMTYSYMGVNGGFVLVAADEPGMHSSQNEQDSRNWARFGKMAMVEPSSSQEAKDMMKSAIEISEKFDTPVILRTTTRICHSKSSVDCYERVGSPIKEYKKNIKKNMPVPAHGRVLRHKVEDRLIALEKFSNETELNFSIDNDSKIGIITSGVCYQYAREVFGDTASYFKIGFSNPLPMNKLKEFASKYDTVYVIEENDPFIEDQLKANKVINIKGREVLPYTGEMTPDTLRESIFGKTLANIEGGKDKIVARPPSFCAGCPHRGFMLELGKRKNTVISGDIGCYALGFAEPYNATDFSLCMGGGFSMAHGAQQVFDMKEESEYKKVVGVMGDATFFHTGINSLLTLGYNKGNSVTVILDNRVTAMTGQQENPGTGFTLQGLPTEEVEIEALVKACKIKNIRTIDPNNLKICKETLDWAVAQEEATVIITKWPCALKKLNERDKVEFKGAFETPCEINESKCIGCRVCLKSGCPALSFDKEEKKAKINRRLCVGCTVCAQMCPVKAISKEEKQ